MRTSPSQVTTTIGEMNGKEMTAIHKGFCAPEAAKSMFLKGHEKIGKPCGIDHPHPGWCNCNEHPGQSSGIQQELGRRVEQAFTGMIDLILQLRVKMILLLALASVRVSHV